MSEVKKIATRDSYGNALVELGKEHDDVDVYKRQSQEVMAAKRMGISFGD